MPVVSVTRLRLRSPRYLPAFIWYVYTSRRQAAKTAGNLGVKLRKTVGLAFWTLTIWRDMAAMRSFEIAAPHGSAMAQLSHWCDEAAFVHWDQSASELPSWDAAAERLRAGGKQGTLRHPSDRHKRGDIVVS